MEFLILMVGGIIAFIMGLSIGWTIKDGRCGKMMARQSILKTQNDDAIRDALAVEGYELIPKNKYQLVKIKKRKNARPLFNY